ncbi:hypothetical protein BBW68_09690 [Candidatus Erwinia dacicola]|uniref:Uncharacterized protein n=1 Tax=Candidatus Erwinia dacicola TaxID=252393 RepID=A0A1E7Z105_9GAMM|nr:hypothetical protein BBW68_09690 [Candidatus Erwinia dacicola]
MNAAAISRVDRVEFAVPVGHTAGYRFCRVTITGIATGPGLVFIVPEIVSHSGIEGGFHTNFFQQPIELIEILWGFEIFGQFISQSL